MKQYCFSERTAYWQVLKKPRQRANCGTYYHIKMLAGCQAHSVCGDSQDFSLRPLFYTSPAPGFPPPPQLLYPIKTCLSAMSSLGSLGSSLGPLPFSPLSLSRPSFSHGLVQSELSLIFTVKSSFSTIFWSGHDLLSCLSCPYLSVSCSGLMYELSDLGLSYLFICVFIVPGSFPFHSSSFFISSTTS